MKKETTAAQGSKAKPIVVTAGKFKTESEVNDFKDQLSKEITKAQIHISKLPATLSIVSRFADIHIVKAKITNAYTIDCAYIDQNKERKTKNACESDAIAHDDLRGAFKLLRVHLAFMCDLREAVNLNFDEYLEEQMRVQPKTYVDPLEKITVTGFTISGGEDGEGIVITGTKQIGMKVLNLNTPFTRFEDLDYPYTAELQQSILFCCDEIKEYLNGKAAMKQLDMFEETTPAEAARDEAAAGF